jgi:hypothetical protein
VVEHDSQWACKKYEAACWTVENILGGCNKHYLKKSGVFHMSTSDACSKLDAKSRKCYFIGYEDEAFRYRFWDDQNRKIIRSMNVTFNENVVFKNGSSAEPASIESEVEKPEFINLDGIPKGTAQRRNSEIEEGSRS